MTVTLPEYDFHEREWDSYDQLRRAFDWTVPMEFNIADYICDRWATGSDRVALYAEDATGTKESYSFSRLAETSAQLANALSRAGIEQGDRIAVSGAQKPEILLGYLAAWKLGAIVVPLSTLFQPDALEYRLNDAGVSAFLVDEQSIEAFRAINSAVDTLETVFLIGDEEPGADHHAFWDTITEEPKVFENAQTGSDDDAAIFYTSGTTGQPKGAVLPHRYLLGILPSYLTTHTNLRVDGVFWMPSEWSWILFFGEIIAGLYFGKPSVATVRERFDPEDVLRIIEEYNVTEVFLPPTGIRMMMQLDEAAFDRYDLQSVRLIESAAEPVGKYVQDWIAEVFTDVVFHEAYGQTEAAVFVGDCEALGVPHRAGKMGVAGPGHDVRVLDPVTGDPVATGEIGELALRVEGNPLPFKRYWNRPDQTDEKLKDGWLLTEDLVVEDKAGYFTFKTRKDDVIISAGYKLGPGEIENTLDTHPAVVEAGVIGIPDAERGEVPKAFVTLTEGVSGSDDLAEELKEYVRDRLAKYAYPREIEFVDTLPKTSTDKIRRHDLRVREGLIE